MHQQAPRRWVVMKFGGTSVRSLKSWQIIAQQVRRQRDLGLQVMLVVSAIRGVTDRLQAIASGEQHGDGVKAIEDDLTLGLEGDVEEKV